ncbi:synaptotagmin-12 [Trichonephila clavipes]|nr:synaptotagmin-12 [Trichonephila clavipes]
MNRIVATAVSLIDTGPHNLKAKVGPAELGDIMFSLSYLPTAERLTVVIVKGRNLRWDKSNNTSEFNPFVKVYLLQNGNKFAKKKTSVKKNERDPNFNEAMIFSVPSNALQQRNPGTSSVVRYELTVVNAGFDAIISYECDFGKPWILSNSHSALQHLRGWSSANDEISASILLKLRKISQTHDVHLKWIPSHVNIRDNEVADRLTKEGSENETATGTSLTY